MVEFHNSFKSRDSYNLIEGNLQFTRLKDLAINSFRGVRDRPGVYVIFWIKDGEHVAIKRVSKEDQRGVLYIGSSTSLRRRIKELWRSIEIAEGIRNRKGYPHTFGPSLIYTGLFHYIKGEDLWVYAKEFATKNEAEAQEKQALLEYTRTFGEPPPLNFQIGREYFLILDLVPLGKGRLAPKLDPDLESALGLYTNATAIS
jgi:hypothetical protein